MNEYEKPVLIAPGESRDASSQTRPARQPAPSHHKPVARSLTATWATVTPVSSKPEAPVTTGPTGWTDRSVGCSAETSGSALSSTEVPMSKRSPTVEDQFPAASPERACSQYDPPDVPPVNEYENPVLAAPGEASDASIHSRPPCQPAPFHHCPVSRFFTATCATVTPVSSPAVPATATGPTGSTSPEPGDVSAAVGLMVSPPDRSKRSPVFGDQLPAASRSAPAASTTRPTCRR